MYDNGGIVGKRVAMENSGTVVKFGPGSVHIEKSDGKYIVATSTNVIKDIKNTSRKRQNTTTPVPPSNKISSPVSESPTRGEAVDFQSELPIVEHETVSCASNYQPPPQMTLDDILNGGSTQYPVPPKYCGCTIYRRSGFSYIILYYQLAAN